MNVWLLQGFKNGMLVENIHCKTKEVAKLMQEQIERKPVYEKAYFIIKEIEVQE